MKEIIYKYNNLGLYETDDDTSFGEHEQIRIIMEAHDFSLQIGNEVLRASKSDRYIITVSKNGEAFFCDENGSLLAHSEKGNDTYRKVVLVWEKGIISIQFGYVDTVDYYPNCDGESDRWGYIWTPQHAVELDCKDNSIKIS